ncbi:SDR family NAD(P)-dependent oxidoreductase [Paraglaciecola arctica]|uniref:SDR family NAD(P)-dependent oxidoreductase n=1 Tax=Paraglaciecola arctica TaxID=1128911 RepID=UPI001C06CD1A|nr:SDR family oxidoreductase [Paraglaciecola arctica]MBU3003918.1 SDR family oxidoreductase [Paraglaciecola arctica]
MQNLTDRVAVISGGTSGIGFAIANELAKEGVKLVLVGMDHDKAKRAESELKRNGAEVIALRCDVTKQSEIDSLVALAYNTFGKVDILINNAGVGQAGTLHEITEADWDWIVDVNLKSVFLMSSAFIKQFIKRGDIAHIMNTGSETCFGIPGKKLGSMFPYVASKHGMLGLSEMMHRDYAEYGIEVSLLCPGAVATEIWDAERSRQTEYGEKAVSKPKLGELLHELGMDPNDVGKMAVAGIKRGDYYIITHSNIRNLIDKRHVDASTALDKTDAWHANNSTT